MSSPSAPPPPEPPDYAKANREAIITDIETLPMRKQIEAAAKLGQKITVTIPEVKNSSGYVTAPSRVETYDFTGYGDADVARSTQSIDAETAKTQAKAYLDLQAEFGDQYVQKSRSQLQASDPEGFAAREALMKQVTEDMARGGDLDPKMERAIEQDIRKAQVARGNSRGSAPIVAEATQKGDARERIKQQRLANVGSALAGVTPTAQFQSIAGAQTGAAPYQPAAMPNGIQVNPNAGLQGTNFALGKYQTQANIWQTQAQIKAAQPTLLDQIGQGVGIAGNLIGGVASAAMI